MFDHVLVKSTSPVYMRFTVWHNCSLSCIYIVLVPELKGNMRNRTRFPVCGKLVAEVIACMHVLS